MSLNPVRIHVENKNAHHWAYSLDGAPDVHMPPGATYVDLSPNQLKHLQADDLVGFMRLTGEAFVYNGTLMILSTSSDIHMFRLFDSSSQILVSNNTLVDAIPHATNSDFTRITPTSLNDTTYLTAGFNYNGHTDDMYRYQPAWKHEPIVASTGARQDLPVASQADQFKYYLTDFQFVRNLVSTGFTASIGAATYEIQVITRRDTPGYENNWQIDDTQLTFDDGTNRFNRVSLFTDDIKPADQLSDRKHAHQFVEFYELRVKLRVE